MKDITRLTLLFIVTIHAIALLVGCSPKAQPKGWVSVEKAPMRVIIVDNEADITPATIKMIMNHVGSQPYKDYPFNTTTQIGVGWDVDYDHHTSGSKQIKIGE